MIKPLLTVWYNTRCPVCDAGIVRQQRRLIEAVKAGRIAFRDINFEPDALAAFGASLEDVRRRLHATDAGGRDVSFLSRCLHPARCITTSRRCGRSRCSKR